MNRRSFLVTAGGAVVVAGIGLAPFGARASIASARGVFPEPEYEGLCTKCGQDYAVYRETCRRLSKTGTGALTIHGCKCADPMRASTVNEIIANDHKPGIWFILMDLAIDGDEPIVLPENAKGVLIRDCTVVLRSGVTTAFKMEGEAGEFLQRASEPGVLIEETSGPEILLVGNKVLPEGRPINLV